MPTRPTDGPDMDKTCIKTETGSGGARTLEYILFNKNPGGGWCPGWREVSLQTPLILTSGTHSAGAGGCFSLCNDAKDHG